MRRRVLVTGGSGFIGTNLVHHLLTVGDEVVSLDVVEPRDDAHHGVWRAGDVLDPADVTTAMADLVPTHVVHLAARTDLDGTTAADYEVNTIGTRNVLTAAERQGGIERLLVASSLLVCRNGYTPSSDTDYCPTTAYGRSKQRAEELVRSSPRGCPWVIARPTSVWGPWFGPPYRDFFDQVLAGRYVHPGHRRVDKAFGYVGNTVVQLEALLDRGADASTHYLADRPAYPIDELADAVAAGAGLRSPRRAPLVVLRAAALIGDAARRLGLWAEPPLTRFRLENMLTPSAYPSEPLDELTGPLPYTMAEGVRATLDWMGESAHRDR